MYVWKTWAYWVEQVLDEDFTCEWKWMRRRGRRKLWIAPLNTSLAKQFLGIRRIVPHLEAFVLYVVHARQGSERNTLAASEENVQKYYTILSPRADVLAKEIVGTRNSPAIISLNSQFFLYNSV